MERGKGSGEGGDDGEGGDLYYSTVRYTIIHQSRGGIHIVGWVVTQFVSEE